MIRLEYFERSDFPQLMDWLKDDELLMNWSGALFSYPLSEKSLEWYLEDVNVPGSDAYVYKVIDTETETIVGHISLGGVSRKNKSARISRVLVGNTADRGKGYCRHMINAVLKIGFDDLNLHRISLGVYDFNIAAINCYKRSGMIVEGTQRDVLLFKEKWWSLVEMSMLETEWKTLQSEK